MKVLRFHPEAVTDLEAAVRWVNDERPGHGDLLYEEVKRRVAQAARFPESGARVVAMTRHHDVRAFTARVFPFRVVTAVVRGERMVIAVAHDHRAPNYWSTRLEP